MDFEKMKKSISIAHVALMAILLFMNIQILINGYAIAAMKITAVLCILSIASSTMYVLGGSGKNVAKYYKLFTALFAVTEFVAFIGVAYVNNDLMRILVSAIILGLEIVLAVGKDLGRELSLSICAVLIIVTVIKTIYCLYNIPVFAGSGVSLSSPAFMHNISSVVLSIIPLLMTIEKYIDKSQRGSK